MRTSVFVSKYSVSKFSAWVTRTTSALSVHSRILKPILSSCHSRAARFRIASSVGSLKGSKCSFFKALQFNANRFDAQVSSGYTPWDVFIPKLCDGLAAIRDGFAETQDGFAGLGDGFAAIRDGFAGLGDGFAAIRDGFAGLGDGFAETQDGFAGLGDGFAATREGFADAREGFAAIRDGIAGARESDATESPAIIGQPATINGDVPFVSENQERVEKE
jgi:hypothetical protein